MKSIAKVKSQRHIKSIPPFCDNPMGKEARAYQELVEKGVIDRPTNRRERKASFKRVTRRMNRNSQ